MSKKEEGMEVEGTVIEALRGGKFLVEMSGESKEKHIIEAHMAGKLRKFNIRIVPGDQVTVEVSPYDIKKGRIVYRAR